jgi:hypothetical protein
MENRMAQTYNPIDLLALTNFGQAKRIRTTAGYRTSCRSLAARDKKMASAMQQLNIAAANILLG